MSVKCLLDNFTKEFNSDSEWFLRRTAVYILLIVSSLITIYCTLAVPDPKASNIVSQMVILQLGTIGAYITVTDDRLKRPPKK